MTDKLLQSRYIYDSDSHIDRFRYKGKSWDLVKLQWWSHRFEYRWACDAAYVHFDGNYEDVIDFVVDKPHAFPFFLSKIGFKNVKFSGLFDFTSWPDYPLADGKIEHLKEDIKKASLGTASCVTCLSVLHELPPDDQISVLNNLIDHVEDGGCLILTIQVPRAKYEVNLGAYLLTLRDSGMKYELSDEIGTPITTKDNNVAPHKYRCLRPALKCYRLFAWKDLPEE